MAAIARFPSAPQALDKTHGCGGLALTERRRRDRGDIDVFAGRVRADSFEDVQVDLGFGRSKRNQLISLNAEQRRDFGNGSNGRCLRDIEIARDG